MKIWLRVGYEIEVDEKIANDILVEHNHNILMDILTGKIGKAQYEFQLYENKF